MKSGAKSTAVLAAVVMLVWLVAGAGCTSRESQAQGTPDITGAITSYQTTKNGGAAPNDPISDRLKPGANQGSRSIATILVEANKDGGAAKIDKASITITTDTKIYDQRGGERKTADISAIMVGERVQVWFTGPVKESYPVQATAREITILRP
ncbi:MAG: DUF3221 domain-containing protein [Chloroflexi bacterium]|nr:DUF3221 domain-containing protein [Chloroflexota bacterium]